MNSTPEPAAGNVQSRPSPWVCHYTLSLLTIIYALNYLDRNIFSIVLQSIKEELLLSDTALGLTGELLGIAVCIIVYYLGKRPERDLTGLTLWTAPWICA